MDRYRFQQAVMVLALCMMLITSHTICAQEATQQIEVRTWRDPATGLVWTQQDNGSDVTWQEAQNYCRNLNAGGYTNWRLGSFPEVRSLFDPTANVNDQHIKGEIQITGHLVWTSSPGMEQGKAFLVFFDTDYWATNFLGSRAGRALCVSGFNPILASPAAMRAAFRRSSGNGGPS
jgi:hypothetical protein